MAASNFASKMDVTDIGHFLHIVDVEMKSKVYKLDWGTSVIQNDKLVSILMSIGSLKTAVYSGTAVYKAVYKADQQDPPSSDLEPFKNESNDKPGSRVLYIPVVADNTDEFRGLATTLSETIQDTCAIYGLTVQRGPRLNEHLFPIQCPRPALALAILTGFPALVLAEIYLVYWPRTAHDWIWDHLPPAFHQYNRLIFALSIMRQSYLTCRACFALDVLDEYKDGIATGTTTNDDDDDLFNYNGTPEPPSVYKDTYIFCLGQMEGAMNTLCSDTLFLKFTTHPQLLYLRYSVLRNIPLRHKATPTTLRRLCLKEMVQILWRRNRLPVCDQD